MDLSRTLTSLALVSLLVTGCLHDGRATTERGGAGIGGSAPEVPAPKQDRCQKMAKSPERETCEGSKTTAQLYARGLSTGDMVCLENGIGDEPKEGCGTRAAVVDAGTGRVLLEIRQSHPDSKWFANIGSQLWFEEGALVDLYLGERGY